MPPPSDESEPSSEDAEDAAKAADAAVRRELVECHRDFLMFLRRRLGNHADAEEVLQDFMERALKRAGDLREIQSVRGWLSRVLATTLIDHHRRASRRRETLREPSEMETLAFEPDVEMDAAVCYCLYRLLPTIKADYSELIWRIDLLSEPRDRVAVSVGLTLNNVNVKLHRARRALKARLEDVCLTCPEHGFLDCRCDTGDHIRDVRQRLGRAP
ncbi:RNA polymerase sigma-70 factor (ECF subfamily) [Phenylobacterium haematophilum]|uniref:RNA polymerase sigma-70 factor (ECF subfamily) n=1 Tax=Phenylobacterium haematophilum TaxID=98513 RepID=A0A840A6Z9_9CAUL|nr:RNA polymerase sigma factor [Phenylobacterium haematophilum]MBB3892987.1 RNA polymerase sigma-70 factor (ECF subfamily) [Phenylobacterium haematophilum]